MTRILAKILTILTSLVLCGVLFQAPISVLADIYAPDAALIIKAWKELLLGVIAILLAVFIWRTGTIRNVLRDKFVWIVGAIGLLYGILLLVFDNSYVGEAAGLLIDVRIYLFFIEVYLLVKIWPQAKRPLLSSFACSVGVVLLFAVLQVTLLPKDSLALIGYSQETIQPYLTVDLNPDYVRINSTLRGPNPLGALAVITFSLIATEGVRFALAKKRTKLWMTLLVFGLISSLVALWYSYSRSALLAWVAACMVIGLIWMTRKLSVRMILIGFFACIVGILGVLYSIKDTAFIQNVVFHTNVDGGSVHKSDQGHIDSLTDSVMSTVNEPFGTGIGSVGSASLLTDKPMIVENQYLYMAHESGWLGLLLQLGLFVWIMVCFWRNRHHSLSLALLASGSGMAIIGLVLPVWADDTIGLVWWGLAGCVMAVDIKRKTSRNHKGSVLKKHHKKWYDSHNNYESK